MNRWTGSLTGKKWHIIRREGIAVCGAFLSRYPDFIRDDDMVHKDDKCKNCLRAGLKV